MIRRLILMVLLVIVSFYSCNKESDLAVVEEGMVGKWCSIVDGAEDFWIEFKSDSLSKCGKGEGSVRNGIWFIYDKDSLYFTIEDSMLNPNTGEMFVMNEVYRGNYKFANNDAVTMVVRLYKWGNIKMGQYTMHLVRCE